MCRIRVAYEIGAGNENSAKFAAKVSVFNSLLVGFVFFIIIIAFPDKMAMIFVSSSSVISMVEELAWLLAITILFNSIQPILSGKIIHIRLKFTWLSWNELILLAIIGIHHVREAISRFP